MEGGGEGEGEGDGEAEVDSGVGLLRAASGVSAEGVGLAADGRSSSGGGGATWDTGGVDSGLRGARVRLAGMAVAFTGGTRGSVAAKP